jgi:hypothetical protein
LNQNRSVLEVPYRPRARVNLLSVYGLIGLAVAAVVHFGTYVGHVLSPNHPLFLGLHIGIFPLAAVFVFRGRAWEGAPRGGFRLKQMRMPHSEFRPYVPAWVPPLLALLGAYAIVNFILSAIHFPPKGQETLTATEAMYVMRGFSGHWLFFYAATAFFFLYVPADAKPVADPAEASN